MLSKPLKVIVYFRIMSKSSFERFAYKDAACKTGSFLPTLFLENEAQTERKNYGTMLFMSKQVCLPKIGSILQKVKIGPKTDIRPFCTKAFNYNMKPYIYINRLKLQSFLLDFLCHLVPCLAKLGEFTRYLQLPRPTRKW